MPTHYEMLTKIRSFSKDRKAKVLNDNYAKMVCQWHKLADGSRERTPSFLINLRKNGKFKAGSGRCFGCGKYVDDFRIICEPALENTVIGVQNEADSVVEPLFDEKTDALTADEDELSKISNILPWNQNEDWRSIKGRALIKVGAKLHFDEDNQNLMVYLPCMVRGRHVGGIKANLVKKGKRNYFNTPGIWVRNEGLFLFDAVARLIANRRFKTIVIVEGPRDALRCFQLGIPAVAILGTGNWSEYKAELIASLDINRIIIAMDGDAAGKNATKKVMKSFDGEIDTYIFNFSKYGEDVDPGNAHIKVMRRLKSHIL